MSMTGQVASLHALMPIVMCLPGHPDLTIEFVVDTGFTGALSLPPEAVIAMGLPFLEDLRANLVRGFIHRFHRFTQRKTPEQQEQKDKIGSSGPFNQEDPVSFLGISSV